MTCFIIRSGYTFGIEKFLHAFLPIKVIFVVYSTILPLMVFFSLFKIILCFYRSSYFCIQIYILQLNDSFIFQGFPHQYKTFFYITCTLIRFIIAQFVPFLHIFVRFNGFLVLDFFVGNPAKKLNFLVVSNLIQAFNLYCAKI